MEPRAGAAQALTFRLRLVASCVLLVGLALAQSPGVLVADTKLDLALAPGDFLLRAAHLWDAEGAFGQLQNQAYGYLWPMGPFFWIGSLLEVPEWAVQRLWVALVMCVAMLGVARLAKALGVRSDLAAIAAAFAYALSPRMLTTLGPISIEAWPGALAPWVLLPLVLGSRAGSPRRAAALSALAVAMVGGVNAAAAFAVIPLGALWLLTRSRGPRRRVLMTWWPLFTLLGTLWWLVPLFLMGAYSPPFLDFIEAADNTTFPTTLFDALRGTSNWVPYVDTSWRAGNDLIRDFYLPINGGVLLFVGLWGIARGTNPHRVFLALATVVGLLAVTAGHTGSVQGWLAPELNALLDGALAPLRNVHKFDPLIRLPLVLGLAWFLEDALTRMRADDGLPGERQDRVQRFNLAVLVGTTVVAVAGAAVPAIAGRLAPSGGFEAVPGYWEDAAAFLAAEYGDEGTALVVPGSAFGSYVWGFPRDEPMQSIAASPWAVRNAVPLTPAGNIRMLDAIEARLSQGRPSPGLAAFLSRAGISALVVRNDVAPSADAPDPVLVHQALDGSPGLRRVVDFGPLIGGEAHLEGEIGRMLVNGGWQSEYSAIEIYDVAGAPATAVTSDAAPVVVGGPEDLLDLADLGLLADEPTVLAPDVEGAPGPRQPVILTDGLRRTERHFGRTHNGTSATLADDDDLRLENPARDYLPTGFDDWTTSASYTGIAGVSASSSMADADASGTVQPGRLPFAAVDGVPGTMWVADQDSQPSWWQLDLEGVLPIDEVTVQAGPEAREVIRIVTENRTVEDVPIPAGSSRTVVVSDGGTGWLRLEDASGRVGHRPSIAEVVVDGVEPHRSLVLPTLPETWGNPDAVVLRRLADARDGCATIDAEVRCVPGREVAEEEPTGFRRAVTLSFTQRYDAELMVQARPGTTSFTDLLLTDQPASISASSVGVGEPRASAFAAIDGDPGTTWTAAGNDQAPTLVVSWLGDRQVRGLRLAVGRDTAARLPEKLVVAWLGGRQVVDVGRNGVVRLRPFVADRVAIGVRAAEPAVSLDFDSSSSQVPVGVGELRVVGVPFVPVALPRRPVSFPCGTGPTLVVNGTEVRTAVDAPLRDLYAGSAVPARLCESSGLELLAGLNQVYVRASAALVPSSLVLSDGSPVAGTLTRAERQGPDPASSEVAVTGGGLLNLRINTNPGWEAQQAGDALEPVVVDGWQQGWQLVDDEAPVQVAYAPDTAYRAGLLTGLLTLVLLVVGVLGASRRTPGPGRAPPPALDTARVPAVLVVVAALGAGGLLAGWWGVAAAAVGVALGLLTGTRGGVGSGWQVAVLVVPSALAYAIRPWGSQAGWAGSLAWPHYLVVVSCAGVLGVIAASLGRRRRPTSRSRIAGISTTR